ncbi:hypothetical protein CIB84_002762 [Bambusicola thoracicus]|uniref:Uncharacterized protein n=1 Tax=Bambusicola thoracicus TaxID=9083 RepID=A0A2P4TAV6_BAMTH|nr:hypothetical protein CIB84_002762 [Bambusicola thoracicus]
MATSMPVLMLPSPKASMSLSFPTPSFVLPQVLSSLLHQI